MRRFWAVEHWINRSDGKRQSGIVEGIPYCGIIGIPNGESKSFVGLRTVMLTCSCHEEGRRRERLVR